MDIRNLAEFYILTNSKGLKPSQEILRRYMHPSYDNRFLLAMHRTGWGKTHTFALISIIYSCKNIRVFVITKGEIGKKNFSYEIDKLSKKYNIVTKQRIQYRQYLEFASAIKEMSEDNIIDTFNNSLFILDEVHNIKSEDFEDEDKEIKKSLTPILTLARLCNKSKFLCASATPMINSPLELMYIISIYKLIYSGVLISSMEEALDEIDSLKMRVCYSEDEEFTTKVKYVGHKYRNTRIVPVVMSGEQRENYIKTVNDANLGERTCMSIKERMASLCHVSKSMDYYYTIDEKRKVLISKEGYKDLYISSMKGISRKYCKALSIIESVKGPVFVFCENVKDVGIDFFRAFLQANGYMEYNGEPLESLNRLKRYTYLVGDDKKMSRLDAYNNESNIGGDYIKVLVGSKVIGESISLMRTRTVVILTLSWNLSTERQIIGRVVRRDSHTKLPIEEQVVRVHRLVSLLDKDIYNDNNECCIDLRMVRTMLNKEEEISPIINKLRSCSIENNLYKDPDCNSLVYDNLYKYHFNEIVEVHSLDVWRFIIKKQVCYVTDMLSIFNGNMHILLEAITRMIMGNVGYPYIGGKALYLRRWGSVIHIVNRHNIPFECCPQFSLSYTLHPRLEFSDEDLIESEEELPGIEHLRSYSPASIISLCRNGGMLYGRKVLRFALQNNIKSIIKLFRFCVVKEDNVYYSTIFARDGFKVYVQQYIDVIDKRKVLKCKDGNISVASSSEVIRILSVLKLRLSEFAKEHKFYIFISVGDWKTRMLDTTNNEDVYDSRYKSRGLVIKDLSVETLRHIYLTKIYPLSLKKGLLYSRDIDKKTELVSIIEQVALELDILILY